MSSSRTLLLAVSIAALGCSTPEPEPSPVKGGATQLARGDAPVEGQGHDPVATDRAADVDRAAVEVTRAVDELNVRWPAPSARELALVARLPGASRLAVDASTMPVLAPRRSGFVEKARFVVKPKFYAASLSEDDGLHVFVSATKIAHRFPGMPKIERPQSVRGQPAWVLGNEGIWSATWEEHGVSYVVEVSCARPSEDARCSTADTVVAVAEDLAFIGGRGPSGAATAGGAK